MAISTVGTTSAQATGTNLATLSVTTSAIGNAWVLSVRCFGSTATVAAVSGGGATGWVRIAGPFTGVLANSSNSELWLGPITSVGTSNITVTYSVTPGNVCDLVATQFTNDNVQSKWARDGTAQAGLNNASSTSAPFPNLNSSGTGRLYFGHMRYEQTGAVGATTGYTYRKDPNGNIIAFNPAIGTGAITGPASTQSPAGRSTGHGVLVVATLPNTAAFFPVLF